MIAQSSFARSTSNPIRLPDASFAFHGGYAPSVPIFIESAKATELNKVAETNKDKKSFFNIFIHSSNYEFNKVIIPQI